MGDQSRTELWSEDPDLSETGSSCPVQLVVIEGARPGFVYDVKEAEVRLGRSSDNDFVLESNRVSKQHARLSQDLDEYFLEDLGSTNKTWLNETLLEPNRRYPMCHGDSLKLADQLLMFRQAASFIDADGVSTIKFDREKVRQEVDSVLDDLKLKRGED